MVVVRLDTRADERQRQLGGFEAISSLLKDFRDKETARQDKQQLLDFVKLTQSGMSTEEAAAQVTASQPQFDSGLGGIFQRLGHGGANPQSVLNIAIQSQLDKPSDLEAREREAKIEANKALAESRRGKVATDKPTAGQKQRDADIKVLNDKKKTQDQKNEARIRLESNPDLFDISEVGSERIDKEFTKFAKIAKESKKLKIPVPGKILDKMFGEEAFNKILQDVTDQGLSEGISPESTEEAFITWWDEQAAKGDKIKGFGVEFQPRTKFQAGTDIDSLIEKALTDGKINQDELTTITEGLKKDPSKVEQVRRLIESR